MNAHALVRRLECGAVLAAGLSVAQAQTAAPGNWDPPAVEVHPVHDDFVTGKRPLEELIDAGRRLFRTPFNRSDGSGRPAATGDSKPTIRTRRDGPLLQRIAGPDANSCAGCHNRPIEGGSGDFADNVFVGAHFTDPPTRSIASEVTNERGTLSVFGAGAIEMLAREMTTDLHDQRDAAKLQAQATGTDCRAHLESKGVDFGFVVVHPDGTYATDEIRGVDPDLVVKPFGVKGVAVSLREFTNFALNQHHGIQSEERFGWSRTGVHDFDEDGVDHEATVGQVTALAVYQASLPPPRRMTPKNPEQARATALGERRFAEVGCTACHRPSLPLRSAWFFEPSPFNRPGSVVPADVAGQVALTLPVEAGSGVYRQADGEVRVAAFTDLKRHVICDEEDDFFCNERLRQDFVPIDQFLTTKLWDVGSSASYGHRKDLTTVSEAIVHHSGEAAAARRAFLDLPDPEKTAIILFLKSLRIDEDEAKSR